MLLVIVGAYRLTLLDRGAMAFVDETMYYKSALALQELRAGRVRAALTHIATNNGRPGAAIVMLPAAALQAIPYAFGVSPSNPRSLIIPRVFTVIVSLATLYFLFDICLVMCGDATIAFAAAAVYAFLVNSNVYVRHTLPYDWALSALVYALWIGTADRRTVWRAAAAGVVAGAAVTIYPGYYLVAVIPGIAIAAQEWPGRTKSAVRLGAGFVVSAVAVVAAMEWLCRAAGVSYIQSVRTLSRTITQGTFEEGWTFLPAYLLEVERASGLALLCGTAVYVWRAGTRLRRLSLRPIDWLILPALAGWMWEAASSYHWHTMVFYGRLIHPWMLFMAWALADAISAIDRGRLRTAACAAALTCAAVSWTPAALAYYRLAYPADVLYALRIDTKRVPPDRLRCEFAPATSYRSPGPLNRDTRYPYTNEAADTTLRNFCQGAPAPTGRAAAADRPGGSLVFDAPHFLTFPAYGFEGFSPQAREALVHGDYRVRVYARGP